MLIPPLRYDAARLARSTVRLTYTRPHVPPSAARGSCSTVILHSLNIAMQACIIFALKSACNLSL